MKTRGTRGKCHKCLRSRALVGADPLLPKHLRDLCKSCAGELMVQSAVAARSCSRKCGCGARCHYRKRHRKPRSEGTLLHQCELCSLPRDPLEDEFDFLKPPTPKQEKTT